MKIAIIGSGISGVTLALRLQQIGIETTVYSEKSPDEIRTGRLLNTVARFEHTVDRERLLGVDHWPHPEYQMSCIHFSAGEPLSLSFRGRPPRPVRAVDFRELLPAFLNDYVARGGTLVIDQPIDVAKAAHGHDLAVVAVGRTSIAGLFHVDPERSPYAAPQRRLFAGIFDGLDLPDPIGLSFNVAPGVGEIFQMPIWTKQGLSTNLLVEAIPGGPLAALAELPPADLRFVPTLRELLEVHAPAIAQRVGASFALRSPLDALQGAITPAVRNAFATLPSGTPALAIGDAWITNDPITGQGANIGSHCAWVAAEHIAAGGSFDVEWGRRVEAEMWTFAGPVTAWTNAFLQPPPPHVIDLLIAAARNQNVADAFAAGFADPVAVASVVSAPETTDAFIRSVSGGVAVAS